MDGKTSGTVDQGELAYLAGVLDTRAIVRTRLVGGSHHLLPYVAVSSPDGEVLDWLSQITGVKMVVTTRSFDKHRCLEHCTIAHEHVTSVSGRWSVSGSRATVVLVATRPWVRFQESAWDSAIAVGVGALRKDKVVQKMEGLGWPLPVAWTAL